MRWLTMAFLLMLGLVVPPVAPVSGDEVIFLNGDRLSGKILTASGGKLTIKTEGAGDVTVDLAKVKTFSTDEPVRVGVGEQPPVSSRVSAGPDRQVQTSPATGAPPQPLPIGDIRTINQPPPAWTGSFAVNGLLTTGNSETEQLGFRAGLSKLAGRPAHVRSRILLRQAEGSGPPRDLHHDGLRDGFREIRSLLHQEVL